MGGIYAWSQIRSKVLGSDNAFDNGTKTVVKLLNGLTGGSNPSPATKPPRLPFATLSLFHRYPPRQASLQLSWPPGRKIAEPLLIPHGALTRAVVQTQQRGTKQGEGEAGANRSRGSPLHRRCRPLRLHLLHLNISRVAGTAECPGVEMSSGGLVLAAEKNFCSWATNSCPSGAEFQPDRCDGLVIQHLGCARKHDLLLHLDVFLIEMF